MALLESPDHPFFSISPPSFGGLLNDLDTKAVKKAENGFSAKALVLAS
jgi:hypothetical protein